jgi:hypothetical protein
MLALRVRPKREPIMISKSSALFALGILVGCGGSFRERFEAQEIPRLKERAAFDLNCPKDQLQTTELGSMATQGVSGCGRRATYVQAATGQWIMNTDEHPQK